MFGGMVGAVVGTGALRRRRKTTLPFIRPVGLHGTGPRTGEIRWSSFILIAGWALLWLGNPVLVEPYDGWPLRTGSFGAADSPCRC